MTLSQFRALPEEDQNLALALDMYEADLCPGCGQPRTYSTDPGTENHWHVPHATRCQACTAIYEKQRQYDKPETRAPRALQFHAEPSDVLRGVQERPRHKT